MDGDIVVEADELFDCDELFDEVYVARTERLTRIDPDVVRDRRDVAVARGDG